MDGSVAASDLGAPALTTDGWDEATGLIAAAASIVSGSGLPQRWQTPLPGRASISQVAHMLMS
jgi:hypothetical protein